MQPKLFKLIAKKPKQKNKRCLQVYLRQALQAAGSVCEFDQVLLHLVHPFLNPVKHAENTAISQVIKRPV